MLAVAAAAVLMGCMFLPRKGRVVINQKVPIKDVRRIAVLPFKTDGGTVEEIGSRGRDMADVYARELLDIGFDVVEAEYLEDRLQAAGLSLPRAVDVKGVVAVGEILGVQGLVLGTIVIHAKGWNWSVVQLVSAKTGSVVWDISGKNVHAGKTVKKLNKVLKKISEGAAEFLEEEELRE